jgi:hypothetical protein
MHGQVNSVTTEARALMNSTADRRAWVKLRTSASWLSKAWDLGQALRPQAKRNDQLFVVGTSTFDPWHVAAHLDDEARLCGLAGLRPTLLRWNPPADAPAHLSHSFDTLRETSGGPTVLVVAPDALDEVELERLADARRRGANLLAVSAGEGELTGLANESVTLSAQTLAGSPLVAPFEVATHLVAVSAGTVLPRQRSILRRNC